MTAAFWVSTAQTVVFLAICGFAWWLMGGLLRLAGTIKAAAEHAQDGANRANRAAIDARATLDYAQAILEELRTESAVLRQWWEAHSGDPDPTPATVPQPIVSPDTVPQAEAMTAAPDPWVAAEMAKIEAKLGIGQDPVKGPRKRAGTTAVRKTA